MFNLSHILYIVISTVVTAAFLVLAGLFVKNEKYKKLIIQILAIVTVALHFSDLYVQFFTTGSAEIASPQLLPVYPCNILMWMLLICAFLKNHNGKVAKVLLEFTFYAGIVCGIIGIVLNENFDSNPTLSNWFVLKGLLSHSTLVAGCIYILVAKFIKIRVSNCISVFLGLCFFMIDGLIINGLYLAFGLGERNSMYLQSPPFAAAPWFGSWLMGIIGIIIVFAITAIYEQCALKKEERWYVLLNNQIIKIKNKKHKGETK